MNSALGNLISVPTSLDVSVSPDFRVATCPVALVFWLSQEKSFLFSFLVVKAGVVTSKLFTSWALLVKNAIRKMESFALTFLNVCHLSRKYPKLVL